MPFEITNLGNHFLVKLYGVLTPDDLTRLAVEAEVAEDSVPEALDRITDMGAVERFDIGFPSVRTLAERRKKRAFSRPVKSALIAREPVQVGLARMFQSLNTNPMIEIRIVSSMQEAEEWLGGK